MHTVCIPVLALLQTQPYTTKNKGSLKRHVWEGYDSGEGTVHASTADGCTAKKYDQCGAIHIVAY
jgi:hypothetical protein